MKKKVNNNFKLKKKEKKGFFNLSQIKLAQSSLKLGDTDIKNSVLSLKYLQKNFNSKKNKPRRKVSERKLKIKNLNKIYKESSLQKQSKKKLNYNSKRDLTSSIYNKPFMEKCNKKKENNIFPKLENKFKDKFYNAIEDYRGIFGNSENLKINLQQLKLMLSHLGVIGSVQSDWTIDNENEKKLVEIIFDILSGKDSIINFDLLEIFLILINQLNENNLKLRKFENKNINNKKENLKENFQVPKLKKNDFSFSKKKDDIDKICFHQEIDTEPEGGNERFLKRKSESQRKDKSFFRFNTEVELDDKIKREKLNFSVYKVEKRNFLNTQSPKNEEIFDFRSTKKSIFNIENKKLFSADINVGNKKKTIEIRENNDVENVTKKFALKHKLSDRQYKKLLKVLKNKKTQVLLKKRKS